MSIVVSTYNAELSAGSLLLRESREVAKLLLSGADEKEWHRALVVDNVLQKGTPSTATRMARLLRNRLQEMPAEFLTTILEGTTEVAIQFLMIAAIKHSSLLGDFMLQVLRPHYRQFNNKILPREWDEFLLECEHIDPAVKTWSKTTRDKLGQVAYRILAEAGYLNNTRSLELQTVILTPEVMRYLTLHNEDFVLKCMGIANE